MRAFVRTLFRQYGSEVPNVLILGAAGRDFHDFNTHFRDNKEANVVAFTATQIPDIVGRVYPPSLSGKLYPDGIPIYDEIDLGDLIEEFDVDECVLSYSDLPHTYVMNVASRCLSYGTDFRLIGPNHMMLEPSSGIPVVSVNATRTGCGKSQTSRKIADWFKSKGIKAVAMRHPMPYGDLELQKCQRYSSYEDLALHKCTIEEMEEYEPYIERGLVVYAGVDYQEILNQAEAEADVIIWDGGNNDLPFVRPDVHFVVADAHRPNHEITYHPGETNFRMADVIIINKINTGTPAGIRDIETNAAKLNPDAVVIHAASPCTIQDPEAVRGKRVLVVEDGPTLTHGNMSIGAGFVVAEELGCEIVDPRPYAIGSIKETFENFEQLESVLPAMGYGDTQMAELEETIRAVDCDVVIVGTPIDLAQHITIDQPNFRVLYELDEQDVTVFEILEERIMPLL